VGLDKAVFASVLAELRKLTDGLPGDGGWSGWRAGWRPSWSSARWFRKS